MAWRLDSRIPGAFSYLQREHTTVRLRGHPQGKVKMAGLEQEGIEPVDTIDNNDSSKIFESTINSKLVESTHESTQVNLPLAKYKHKMLTFLIFFIKQWYILNTFEDFY